MSGNLTTLDSMMKDLFPWPGQPVKEWVLKARAERAELERAGRRVAVAGHDDNTGWNCRNVGPATLVHDLVQHDCCGTCNWQGERTERLDSGALPIILDGADWNKYAAYSYAPIWPGWLGMWRGIAELRERAFRADEILFGGG